MPRAVFAAHLDRTRLSVALVNSAGKILLRGTEAADLSSPRAAVGQICRLLQGMRESSRSRIDLVAAGVAVPGLVRRHGMVFSSHLPGWGKVPLSSLLERRLRLPLVVESDGNAAVLGEMWRGAGRGKSDLVALLVGAGISSGIIAGGRLLRGAHGLCGSAGWMAVSEADGDDVRQYGGLEAFTAGPGIARAAVHAVEAGFGGSLSGLPSASITAAQVAAAARIGDPVARQMLQRTGKLLGLAVANLISLFDPEVVVLGGEVMQAADLFFQAVERTARQRCQPMAANKVRILVSRLGDRAVLLGAARAAWERIAGRKAGDRERHRTARNLK